MSPMITRRAEKEFVRQVADRAPIKEHHWDEMMIKDVLASDDWQLVLCMYLGNERFWEGTNFSGSNLKCSISFSIYRKVPSSSSRDQARPAPPAGRGREVCSPLSIMSHITQGHSALEIIRITHSWDKMPDNAAWEICTSLCGPEKLIQVCFRKILISYQPRMAITFRLKLLYDSLE